MIAAIEPFARLAADRLQVIETWLRSLLGWWLGSLRSLLPPGLRRWSGWCPGALLLRLHDDRVEIVAVTDGERRSLGIFPVGADASSSPAVRALQQRPPGARTRNLLRLPAGQVLRCPLTLPAAARENLRQVLAYEMDRHTPFGVERVCFDYRITSTNADRVELDLYVAPLELVERGVGVARRLGLVVHGVDVEAEEDRASHAPGRREAAIDLLPAGLKPPRYSRRQLLNRGLAVLALLLVAVDLCLPIWRQGQRLAVLEAAVDEARGAAEAAFLLRDQRADLLATLGQLDARRRTTPPALVVLDDLSDRLPDSSWLQRVEFAGGGIELQGESAAASALIGLLEASPLLEAVSFRSPVVQDARSNRERFHVAARLSAGGEP